MIKRALFLSSLLATLAVHVHADGQARLPYCQILDNSARPLYAGGLLFTDSVAVEGGGDAGLLALDSYWDLAFYRNVFRGDVALTMVADLHFYNDDAGIGLPGELAKFAYDIQWTRRTLDGAAYRVGLSPGFYSELSLFEGRSLHVPVHLAYIRSLDPTLSAMAGLDVRLGYEVPVFPHLGVTWMPHANLRVQAMVPEARVDWYAMQNWVLYAGAGWVNREFSVDDNGVGAPERLMEEDIRLFLGGRRRMSDDAYFTFEIGELSSRTLEYDRVPAGPRSFDYEDALYVRLGLAGPF